MLATYGLHHYCVRSFALYFSHLIEISESLAWQLFHCSRQRVQTKNVPIARRAENPTEALQGLVKPSRRFGLQVRREEVQRCTTPRSAIRIWCTPSGSPRGVGPILAIKWPSVPPTIL
jgi:hypothetical protein